MTEIQFINRININKSADHNKITAISFYMFNARLRMLEAAHNTPLA